MKKGEEVRIIAQSQFDVNQEIIEGTVLVGSSTGNRMVFSRLDKQTCLSE
jgi:hypothetical protein